MLFLGHNFQLTTLDAGLFSNLTSLKMLNLAHNRFSTLDAGLFSNLTALETLNLRGNAVDPLPIILSLELIEEGQFKVRVHTGAPFIWSCRSLLLTALLSVMKQYHDIHRECDKRCAHRIRTPGTTAAVTVDIGELPALPPDNYGYALVKSSDLPLEAIALINKAPTFTLDAPVIRAVDENTAGGQNIGAPISATVPMTTRSHTA